MGQEEAVAYCLIDGKKFNQCIVHVLNCIMTLFYGVYIKFFVIMQ
jgi:hypothetical protein